MPVYPGAPVSPIFLPGLRASAGASPRYNKTVQRLVLLLATAFCACAQLDERRVSSPNGQLEFRIFIAPPPDSESLDGIAYQVWLRGTMLIRTSYLGFDIFDQTPFLGEKVGLVSAKTTS